MFLHELGKIAKDKLTGFQGVITSRCQFLTGCNRYCIQPQALHDGKPQESFYFDEAQIEIISNGGGAGRGTRGEKRRVLARP